jgi:hypothetical protein
MEGHLNNSKGFAPLSLLSALLMNPKHLSLFLSPSKLHFKFLGFIFQKKRNQNSTQKSTRNLLRMLQRATARQLATMRQPEGAATRDRAATRESAATRDRATTCNRAAISTVRQPATVWQG